MRGVSHPQHPPEFVERVRYLAEVEQWSAGRIANEVGISRNAVIGVCHRADPFIRLPGSNGGGGAGAGAGRPRSVPSAPVAHRTKGKFDWHAPLPPGEKVSHPHIPLVYIEGQGDAVAELIGPPSSVEVRPAKVQPYQRNVQTSHVLFAMSGPCRYLDGAEPPFHQCGKVRVEGLPYCTYHASLCYRAQGERWDNTK